MSLPPMDLKEVEFVTCIMIYLKTSFVKTYAYLEQCISCFLMYKSILMYNLFYLYL